MPKGQLPINEILKFLGQTHEINLLHSENCAKFFRQILNISKFLKFKNRKAKNINHNFLGYFFKKLYVTLSKFLALLLLEWSIKHISKSLVKKHMNLEDLRVDQCQNSELLPELRFILVNEPGCSNEQIAATDGNGRCSERWTPNSEDRSAGTAGPHRSAFSARSPQFGRLSATRATRPKWHLNEKVIRHLRLLL